MKRRLVISAVTLIALVLFPKSILADSEVSTQAVELSVSGKALIKVTGEAVKLSLNGPSDAGADPTLAFGHSAATRLKMSSLTSAAATNKIVANVTSTDNMSESNTRLFLRLLPPTTLAAFKNYTTAANGLKFGAVEAVTKEDILTNPVAVLSELVGPTAITLVDGIGTAWSGTADDNGYVIEYNYMATGDGAPVGRNIEVTYTIMAQ